MVAAIELSSDALRDLERLLRLEWLEANGLGGFACGTVAGAATRRYHALLCVATRPPVARMVLVDNLEVAIVDGDERHALSTNLYPGAVHPQGYRALSRFRLDPWPIWTHRAGRFTVEREAFMPHGADALVLRFRMRGGGATLALRPLVSFRDHHSLRHEGEGAASVSVEEGAISVAWPGAPTVRILHGARGRWLDGGDWYRRVQLPVERERGLDDEQDLFSPGELHLPFIDGETVDVVMTTEARRFDVEALAAAERARRAALALFSDGDGAIARLALAADQFIVARGGQRTVIAGYPWFTDWGRDTFISLPGLALQTGRPEIARAILAAFAPHVDDGMVPNVFPDGGEPPAYNSVDASLWYAIACGRYLDATDDGAFVRDGPWRAVREIIGGYRRGARFGIRVDGDGLVRAGAPGVQLTWMDAKVGDRVITPRAGKPVEVQALWLRALDAAIAMARRFDSPSLASEWDALRRAAARSLGEKFWYDSGWLYDVVDGGAPDASLRPNQLYALALPGILPPARAESALAAVERHLLTPFGLRTLAPFEPDYRGRFVGGQAERDAAYHNGTVWPHLLGAWADAVRNVRGARIGRSLVDNLRTHLADACLGSISEVFDGDPPHEPRGCFAQAWAVAETLRLAVEE